MKKVFLLLILSVLFAGKSMAQDWIVYSESFEDDTDIANWVNPDGDNGFTTASHNATAGVSGSGALELTDGGFAFRKQHPITATAGHEYLLSIDVKTLGWDDQATYPIQITLDGIDANPKTVHINSSTDFTTISIGGTATGSSGQLRITGENVGGENKVWIDNITLSVNQSFILEDNYIESFEDGTDITNWVNPDGDNGFTTASHNATAGVSGSGALELTDGGFAFRKQHPITATAGYEYLLSMDVKTLGWDDQATYPIQIILDGIDSNPKTVHINSSTDFTTITIGGTATGSSGLLIITGENVGGENKVWIDNISLTSIDSETVIWNGTAWNNGAGPTASDNVMVDAPLTVSGDMSVNNIEVTENGALTVESGASLAIMESASGTATIMRNTTGSGGYSIVGSPVIGADLSDLSADYLHSWDGTAWSTPTGPMMPGMGYFAGYDAASPAVSLTGDLVSGDQSVAISTAGDGFNIVANPYAASISIVSFLTANANIDASVYLWNDGGENADANDRGGDYVTVNEIGTVSSENLSDGISGNNVTAANTDIGSMQGFLVHATSNATVDFSPTMQSVASGANSDDNFYRSADLPTLKLALSGDFYNEVLFGFRADASFGVDRLYDAPKLMGNENFAFYSLI